MRKIFISYRRKESVDLTGRLFDYLAGYFGPASVFMDVDVLLSGADYRAQIGRIIQQCDVLLAIIGEHWVTVTDESGSRRLDNPDDQLRIEIMAALEQGIPVIPILIHDADMPQEEDLPADLVPLASLSPVTIESGTNFHRDTKNLANRLEMSHGFAHPDKRLPWEMFLTTAGIALLGMGIVNWLSVQLPNAYLFSQTEMADTSYSTFQENARNMILFGCIPLGLGPMLLVAGARWCCLHKATHRQNLTPSGGIGRGELPKSKKSVYCLGFGLGSFGLSIFTGIPAILLGVWALLDPRLRSGWIRGRTLAIVGILAAIGGICFTAYFFTSFRQVGCWLEPFEKAEQAMAQEDTETALASVQKSIDAAANNLVALGLSYQLKASIYSSTGEPRKAVDELTTFIDKCRSASRKPTQRRVIEMLASSLYERARLYNQLGERERAVEDSRQSEQLNQELYSDQDENVIEHFESDGADWLPPFFPNEEDAPPQPVVPDA